MRESPRVTAVVRNIEPYHRRARVGARPPRPLRMGPNPCDEEGGWATATCGGLVGVGGAAEAGWGPCADPGSHAITLIERLLVGEVKTSANRCKDEDPAGGVQAEPGTTMPLGDPSAPVLSLGPEAKPPVYHDVSGRSTDSQALVLG